jgi:hypothetical protein
MPHEKPKSRFLRSAHAGLASHPRLPYIAAAMLQRLRPSGFVESCLPSSAERPPNRPWLGARGQARWLPPDDPPRPGRHTSADQVAALSSDRPGRRPAQGAQLPDRRRGLGLRREPGQSFEVKPLALAAKPACVSWVAKASATSGAICTVIERSRFKRHRRLRSMAVAAVPPTRPRYAVATGTRSPDRRRAPP